MKIKNNNITKNLISCISCVSLFSPILINEASANMARKQYVHKPSLVVEKKTTNDDLSTNRAIFAANNFLFSKVLRPVGKAYVYATPDVVQNRVSDFSRVWTQYPISAIGNLYDKEYEQSWINLKIFTASATVGLFGLFDMKEYVYDSKEPIRKVDVASSLRDAGYSQEPYVELPLLGGGSARKQVGTGVEAVASPLAIIGLPFSLVPIFNFAIQENGKNAKAFDALEKSSPDFYLTVKDANLQRENIYGREDEIILNEGNDEEIYEDEDDDLGF